MVASACSSVSSQSSVGKSRSVMDFETERTLRSALKDCTRRGSFLSYNQLSIGLPALIEESAGLLDDDDGNSSACPSNDGDGSFGPSESAGGGGGGDNGCGGLNPELDWVTENLDLGTCRAQTLEDELKRLLVLKSYLVLESDKEPTFERITALAARIFSVPICLVSLVDLGRQWFMSNRGLGDVRETPRKVAFCAHCVQSNLDLLIVPDATKDVRFKDNSLVTGPPNIRFYAGAPLVCPEGYRLGTLCLIDVVTHPDGLTLEEKQNLRELADMVMETMVQRRKDKLRLDQDKSKIIACTAHDLLTPLSGVQMSLSLLLEDEALKAALDGHQRDLVQTAGSCSDVMSRICHQAIQNFRGDIASSLAGGGGGKGAANATVEGGEDDPNSSPPSPEGTNAAESTTHINVSNLVNSIRMVMDPFPKEVPLFITVDPEVPKEIISDDLKIFRSTVNYLTNAFKNTKRGSVCLRIFLKKKRKNSKKVSLVFECEDTGPGVDMELYPKLFMPFRDGESDPLGNGSTVALGNGQFGNMSNSGIGLFSVASSISSLGGEYGFRPREGREGQHEGQCDAGSLTGAVFWFSVPLVVPRSSRKPETCEEKKDSIATESKCVGEGGEVTTKERDPANDSVVIEKNVGDGSSETPQSAGETIEPQFKILSLANMCDKEKQEVVETLSGAIENGQSSPTDNGLHSKDEVNSRVKRALVIDDSLVIRKSISRALSKIGFEVTSASNGLEGLNELQSNLYDVVFCDFLMPVMDGLDCVQQYRSWESDHRPWFRQYIIGISAHASYNDAKRGIDVGMNSFISKPVPLKTLKEIPDSAEVSAVSKALDSALASKGQRMEVSSIDVVEDPGASVVPPHLQNIKGPACLVAEDSTTVSKILARAIEVKGWHAAIVEDGEEALRLLKMRNWDAVFLDDGMPRLTGTRCVAEFRDWERDNRIARQNNVYLLSGNFLPDNFLPDRGGQLAMCPKGFDGCLGKPVALKELHRVLEAAVNKNLGGDMMLR